jgi:glucokinase
LFLMFLGIEIGGTKLQLGVSDGEGGALAALERRDVIGVHGAEGIRRQIAEAALALSRRFPVKRVGIGFGGPVDAAAGRTIKSHQVNGWEDFPLSSWIDQTLGLPVALGNDCDVAALAEARLGAGRGARHLLYVTVGTGVGGGLVLDGKLHGQGRPAVAEIGHLRPGPECLDAHATVESIASGQGIERAARAAIERRASHDPEAKDLLRRCGDELPRLTARAVAEAAEAGNSLAASLLDNALRTLGWAIAQTVTLVAVEAVVIGGGVSLIGEERFFSPLRRHLDRYVFPPLAGSYRVMPAMLGEEVVVYGALALAADADRAAPTG